ncbi:hypothetical protein [Deinococcus sonorensis]|uniref:Uncharacterized protein n=2 Tax=Deinococcus sonorensis TaxID=309891 RepID=A0AAU7U6A5_9DEIO
MPRVLTLLTALSILTPGAAAVRWSGGAHHRGRPPAPGPVVPRLPVPLWRSART